MNKNSPPLAIRQTVKQGYVLCPPGGVFNAAFLHCRISRAAVVSGGGKFRELYYLLIVIYWCMKV